LSKKGLRFFIYKYIVSILVERFEKTLHVLEPFFQKKLIFFAAAAFNMPIPCKNKIRNSYQVAFLSSKNKSIFKNKKYLNYKQK
jgi:hypothetical protein